VSATTPGTGGDDAAPAPVGGSASVVTGSPLVEASAAASPVGANPVGANPATGGPPVVDLGPAEQADGERATEDLPVLSTDLRNTPAPPRIHDTTARSGPILSVVICAYNDAKRIATTARSLAAQGTPDGVQIVLIDGASNDATVETASAYLPDLVVASQFDGGIYPAMNRALNVAEGEYVYFLNCGDALRGESVLARLIGELRALPHPVPLIACRVRHLNGGRGAPFVTSTIPFSLARMLAGRQDYNHQAMIFHRGTAIAAGGFPVGYGVVGDYHLILRLALVRPPATREIVIADYEGGGISSADPRMIPRLQAAVRQEVLDLRGVLRVLNHLYGELQSRRRKSYARNDRVRKTRS